MFVTCLIIFVGSMVILPFALDFHRMGERARYQKNYRAACTKVDEHNKANPRNKLPYPPERSYFGNK